MIFVGIFALITMSPRKSGAKVVLLKNSAGRTLKAPKFLGRTLKALKLCRENLQLVFATQNFRAYEAHLAEVWSFWAMQCGHCFLIETKLWGQNYPQKNLSKTLIFYGVFFLYKLLLFHRSIQEAPWPWLCLTGKKAKVWTRWASEN